MTPELIEELLNEEESSTIDFKSEQYFFSKATDDDKSEMLKDILAFANSWRRTDAYILTGVQDVKGGRSNPVGITDDLDDANLQQFVNGKTNRDIEFSYKAATIDGIKIGVFHIPLQERPFYIKKDYGKLKKESVYVRQGSSTKIATIDEIAKMGVSKFDTPKGEKIPELDLEFVNLYDKLLLGKSITVKPVILNYNEEDIVRRRYEMFQIASFSINQSFEKEMAQYEYTKSFYQKACFNITNIGSVLAEAVILELNIEHQGQKVRMMNKNNFPQKPSRNLYRNLNLKSPISSTEIKATKTHWHLTARFGSIQPKATNQSDIFFIASKEICGINLEAKVYANNLPNPLSFPLTIKFEPEEKDFDVTTLVDLD